MNDTRHPPYGQIDRDYARRLATTPPDDDGPVWMVNLMKYHDRAQYDDGSDHGRTGREADDEYTPIDVLTDIGAELVFAGDVEQQLLGDTPTWDRVAIVNYPTRRSFIDMQMREDFQTKHVHKSAGMQQTLVIGCQPMELPGGGPDAGPDWSEVPHPPTDDDGPVMVVHVLKYEHAEATHISPADMDAYSSAAAEVAIPNGARVAGWFAAEGTIVGDGRAWDQVRFNAFPSKAAFMAVVTDPDRLTAQRAHRESATADTYTMIVRPTLDRIADSIA